MWGVQSLNPGSSALIFESVNFSTDIKDYEQQNEAGATKGYLIYDQTVSFDINGTMLYGSTCRNNYEASDSHIKCHWTNPLKVGSMNTGGLDAYELGTLTSLVTNWDVYNNEVNEPTTAIIKTNSFSTSAGNAATFSASGTVYDFS